MESKQTRRISSFAWLNVTQFTGALNDNLFQGLLIFCLIGLAGEAASERVVALADLLDRETDDARHVGILVPPSVGGALANLAVVIQGRIPVNLNFTTAPAALQSAIRQCGIRTVLSSRKLFEKFENLPVLERTLFLEDLMPRLTRPPPFRLRAVSAPMIPRPANPCRRGRRASSTGFCPRAVCPTCGNRTPPPTSRSRPFRCWAAASSTSGPCSGRLRSWPWPPRRMRSDQAPATQAPATLDAIPKPRIYYAAHGISTGVPLNRHIGGEGSNHEWISPTIPERLFKFVRAFGRGAGKPDSPRPAGTDHENA